jgi:small basic protein (TIGR04137 family)
MSSPLRENLMTIDKSLKINSASIRERNVLTRIERLKKLEETDRWKEGDSVFGLAKVRVEKMALRRKKKVKKLEEDELLEGVEGEAEGTADGDAASATSNDES